MKYRSENIIIDQKRRIQEPYKGKGYKEWKCTNPSKEYLESNTYSPNDTKRCRDLPGLSEVDVSDQADRCCDHLYHCYGTLTFHEKGATSHPDCSRHFAECLPKEEQHVTEALSIEHPKCTDHPLFRKYHYLLPGELEAGAHTCCTLHDDCYRKASISGSTMYTSKGCDDVLFTCLGNAYDNLPFSTGKIAYSGVLSTMKHLAATKGQDMYDPEVSCMAPYGSGLVVVQS